MSFILNQHLLNWSCVFRTFLYIVGLLYNADESKLWTYANCNISNLKKTFNVTFRTTNKQRQMKAAVLHPNESSDDLYNSRTRCGVLDLWWWDPCILKDVIGVEPDLWWKVRYTLSLGAQNWCSQAGTPTTKSFVCQMKKVICLNIDRRWISALCFLTGFTTLIKWHWGSWMQPSDHLNYSAISVLSSRS